MITSYQMDTYHMDNLPLMRLVNNINHMDPGVPGECLKSLPIPAKSPYRRRHSSPSLLTKGDWHRVLLLRHCNRFSWLVGSFRSIAYLNVGLIGVQWGCMTIQDVLHCTQLNPGHQREVAAYNRSIAISMAVVRQQSPRGLEIVEKVHINTPSTDL
jgi:hypothetical protein